MFSKLFSEIKIYKKSLILYVVVLILLGSFFLFQNRYFFVMYNKYPEVVYSVLGLMCFQILIRLFYGKDGSLDFSISCLVFFFSVCVGLFLLSSYDNLEKPLPGRLQVKVSKFELIATPAIYYSIIFLMLQSVIGVFFSLFPKQVKEYCQLSQWFAFLFIILVFVATIIFCYLKVFYNF